MNIQNLTIILAVLAIITYLISFIKGILRTKKSIDDPNIKQNLEIALLKKDIGGINKDIHEIKINHLDTIEKDIIKLVKGQARIEGILTKK